MHKKLAEIIQKTKTDLLKRKRSNRSFYRAMLSPRYGAVGIIAEIKLASPSGDDLGNERDVVDRVKQYEEAGVNAISVVTEKHFFKGSLLLIGKIKDVTSLTVLQKDFTIDPYQLYESKIAGADAVLLIAKILSKEDLINLVKLAIDLSIEPVVEINNQEDLKKAVETQTNIIAVNARDLDTFEISVGKACELLKKIPDKFIKLGFSGIHSKAEVEMYKQAGAHAVLVGTVLMKAANIKQFISSLRGSVS